MEITYLGHSAFKIKGKSSVVVTDPYDEMAGRFPKDIGADVLTVSHQHGDHNAVDKIQGPSFKIQGPGEYEVGGVSVVGIATWHDDKHGAERGENTIYVIEMEYLRILHLGDLGHKLTQEQLEEVGSIDMVMVPVGGTYTLDAKTAVEVVAQVDPWVVIPMHYKQAGLSEKLSETLAGVEVFLKELGRGEVQPMQKFQISADRLPSEMQVVVLERK